MKRLQIAASLGEMEDFKSQWHTAGGIMVMMCAAGDDVVVWCVFFFQCSRCSLAVWMSCFNQKEFGMMGGPRQVDM